MTITQQPASLNFSGNLPDILVNGLVAPVKVVLSDASGDLLTENYTPFVGAVRIRLREVIHSLLTIEIPVYEEPVYVQADGYREFTVSLSVGVDGSPGFESESISFTVIKGFLQRQPFDVDLFVRQNWLTFQPRVKRVEFHDPEWLTCFPLEASQVCIEGVYADGSVSTVTYASLAIGKLQSVNVQPGEVIGLFAAGLVGYRVWVEAAGQIRQYKQEYILVPSADRFFNDVFVFENRLGGLDAVRFAGQKKFDHGAETESALIDEYSLEYFGAPDLTIEKNTGFFRSEPDRLFALDFFRSVNRYHVLGGRPARILVSNQNLENIPGQLANYSFSFKYSDNKDALPEYGTPGQNILTFST